MEQRNQMGSSKLELVSELAWAGQERGKRDGGKEQVADKRSLEETSSGDSWRSKGQRK